MNWMDPSARKALDRAIIKRSHEIFKLAERAWKITPNESHDEEYDISMRRYEHSDFKGLRGLLVENGWMESSQLYLWGESQGVKVRHIREGYNMLPGHHRLQGNAHDPGAVLSMCRGEAEVVEGKTVLKPGRLWTVFAHPNPYADDYEGLRFMMGKFK